MDQDGELIGLGVMEDEDIEKEEERLEGVEDLGKRQRKQKEVCHRHVQI